MNKVKNGYKLIAYYLSLFIIFGYIKLRETYILYINLNVNHCQG